MNDLMNAPIEPLDGFRIDGSFDAALSGDFGVDVAFAASKLIDERHHRHFDIPQPEGPRSAEGLAAGPARSRAPASKVVMKVRTAARSRRAGRTRGDVAS